jgi:hypothetical protein
VVSRPLEELFFDHLVKKSPDFTEPERVKPCSRSRHQALS